MARAFPATLALFFALFGGQPPGQDAPYTPEPQSAERKAIMDALRIPIQKQLNQKVIFKIDHLKVQNGWAFLTGKPRQPGGSPIDYRGTPYQEAIDAGVFDDGVCALLRLKDGRWRVVTFTLGATDVPWVEWDKKYKAPPALFKLE
jgi:hypothetical protein